MKKYELLTSDTIKCEGHTLYRIRALRDFGDVKAGDLGGYIEKEDNLSHEEDCWVFENAWVSGNAQVFGNAWVCGDARVYDNAWVFGNAMVCGNARVSGDAQVFGNAWVCGNAVVCEHVLICGNVFIYEDALVCGNARVYGNVLVYGHARLEGRVKIKGNLKIKNTTDVLTIGPIGSRNGYTTFVRQDDAIYVICGCFYGTIEEFEQSVEMTHKGNGYFKKYTAAIDFAKVQLDYA